MFIDHLRAYHTHFVQLDLGLLRELYNGLVTFHQDCYGPGELIYENDPIEGHCVRALDKAYGGFLQ